jgi:L-seryl-tRNA(Ser) seleniumtransferase
MERAGIEQTEFAPVDAATVVAMILLRRHGYMTLPALHYPGASKSLTIHMAQPAAKALSVDEIVHAIDDAFTAMARIITSRERMEAVLFGGPEEVI